MQREESPWLAFLFVVAIVCASIFGLFALPYIAIYFTRGGC